MEDAQRKINQNFTHFRLLHGGIYFLISNRTFSRRNCFNNDKTPQKKINWTELNLNITNLSKKQKECLFCWLNGKLSVFDRRTCVNGRLECIHALRAKERDNHRTVKTCDALVCVIWCDFYKCRKQSNGMIADCLNIYAACVCVCSSAYYTHTWARSLLHTAAITAFVRVCWCFVYLDAEESVTEFFWTCRRVCVRIEKRQNTCALSTHHERHSNRIIINKKKKEKSVHSDEHDFCRFLSSFAHCVYVRSSTLMSNNNTKLMDGFYSFLENKRNGKHDSSL